jgi:hypothetical protein
MQTPFLGAEQAPLARENGPMLSAPRTSTRAIEVVPALLVSLLHDCGKLPPIPNEPTEEGFAFRRPTLNDMQSVSWLAYWESSRVDQDGFRQVAGLAAFTDRYDWHGSQNVRELLSIRGSHRAVVELTRWLIAEAKRDGRRFCGAPAVGDKALIKTMERLGGVVTRAFLEYQE